MGPHNNEIHTLLFGGLNNLIRRQALGYPGFHLFESLESLFGRVAHFLLGRVQGLFLELLQIPMRHIKRRKVAQVLSHKQNIEGRIKAIHKSGHPGE